jgi:high-affinity nickel-transport protein
MSSLDVAGWLGLAMVLGLKHGLDADHLAAIDGISRLHSAAGRLRVARASGLLFSLGHGAMVMLAAWLLRGHVEALPAWLNQAGSWISIGLLTLLGTINLRQVLSPSAAARPGLLAPWLMRLPLTSRPWGAMAIGALFAVSFDTLTIAGWFGVTAARQGGHAVMLLATAFALGMVVADALNGYFVARLLQHSQAARHRAAALFSALVAGLALVVAAWGALRAGVPAIDAWAEGRELWFGLGLLGFVGVGFAWTQWLDRHAAARRGAALGGLFAPSPARGRGQG